MFVVFVASCLCYCRFGLIGYCRLLCLLCCVLWFNWLFWVSLNWFCLCMVLIWLFGCFACLVACSRCLFVYCCDLMFVLVFDCYFVFD